MCPFLSIGGNIIKMCSLRSLDTYPFVFGWVPYDGNSSEVAVFDPLHFERRTVGTACFTFVRFLKENPRFPATVTRRKVLDS